MRKRVLITALVLLAVAIVARIAAGIWSAGKMRAYDAAWRTDVSLERERAASVRRPTVHGATPLDENVTPRYMKLFVSTSNDVGAIASLCRFAKEKTPEVEKLLADEAQNLAALRDATRCTRCDWETPWETAATTKHPNLIRTRQLCQILLLEGRFLPPREGAARALEVIRVGADFEASPVLLNKMIGLAVFHVGLQALGETVVRASPGELDLDAIAKDLDRIAAERPSLSDAVRGERLAVRSYLGTSNDLDGAATRILGGKIFFELAAIEIDAIDRDLEAALATSDPAARTKALDDAEARALASWNPIVKTGFPSWKSAVEHFSDSEGSERVVATALALEKLRAADGTYPAKIDLPIDPSTGTPINYAPSDDRKTWTLSSKRYHLSRQ